MAGSERTQQTKGLFQLSQVESKKEEDGDTREGLLEEHNKTLDTVDCSVNTDIFQVTAELQNTGSLALCGGSVVY